MNMNRFVIFGDTQFHNWQESSRPNRWKDMTNIIGRVFNEARSRKAHVVFLGDLFEHKKTLRIDVLDEVYTRLNKEIAFNTKEGLDTFMVSGNHDIYNGYCTLRPFNELTENVFVADKQCLFVERNGMDRILCVPYNANPSAKEMESADIVFMHKDVRGAWMNLHTQCNTSGIQEDVLSKCNAKFIFNGHYHHPQLVEVQNKNIICVGSPYHINWSDAYANEDNYNNQLKRGIVYLDATENKIESIQTEELFPRFFKYQTTSTTENDFTQQDHKPKRFNNKKQKPFKNNNTNPVKKYVKEKYNGNNKEEAEAVGNELLSED